MSTPLKHYGSSDGFTPSTNTRSSTHDFASPLTALTNYSPELIRKLDNDLGGLMNNLSLSASATRHSLDDPFVDDRAAASEFIFSATAADYAPQITTAPAPAGGAQSLAHSSSSPSTVPSNRPVKLTTGGVANLGSASTTRYVKVTGPPEDEAGMTRIKDVKTMEASIATKKLDDGALIFRFDHVKDAQIACTTTRSLFNLGSFPQGWSADFISAADFHGDHSRDYEGQLKVAIAYQGEGQTNEGLLYELALATIQGSAEIMSSTVKSYDSKQKMLTIDIYLASVRAAEAISKKYNHEWQTLPGNDDIEMYAEHNCSRYPISSKPWVTSRSSGLGSLRGHGNGLAPYNAYMSPDKKDSKVDISSIDMGQDCRTTVMIRNIPNKIDADMFKTILDENVFGRYDFSYLRIDFTNNCNVGYAFVNFKNPRDIITLYKELVGKPWEVFSSDKIADVCYATNQGLGTCIEKFRNSSVMLEWAPHRPKLWYTLEDGPELAGTEKLFPEPSNLQKLHRSRANASSIGLFPPRGLQVGGPGMSPTRGAHGDMHGLPWSAPLGQNHVRAASGAGVMMSQLMPNHSSAYTTAYAHGHRMQAVPYGGMYEQMQPFQTASVPGARNIMGDLRNPMVDGFASSAFMGPSPYGHPGAGLRGRF